MPSSSSSRRKRAWFQFVTAGSSKETSTPRVWAGGSPNSSPSKMKKILHNWLAKVLSLVLALILWAVIRKSLAPTTSPSRFQFEMEQRFQAEDKFQFDTSRHGHPAKK